MCRDLVTAVLQNGAILHESGATSILGSTAGKLCEVSTIVVLFTVHSTTCGRPSQAVCILVSTTHLSSDLFSSYLASQWRSCSDDVGSPASA